VRLSGGKYFNAMSKGCQREEDLELILEKEAVGRSVGRLDCHHRRTMESATTEEATPNTTPWISWLIPRTRPAKTITLTTLAWITGWFATGSAFGPGSLSQHLLTDIGIALIGIDMIGAAFTVIAQRDVAPRRNHALRRDESETAHAISPTPTQSEPDRASSTQPTPAESTPIEPTERSRVARAALAFFNERLAVEPRLSTPTVQLIRVGTNGVELLLTEPGEAPPGGFSANGGGLVWRVQPQVDLEAMLNNEPPDRLPDLIALGDDDESTYFISPDLDDPPFCEELPIDDPSASSSSFRAAITLMEMDGTVILEPFALRLLPKNRENTDGAPSSTQPELLPREVLPVFGDEPSGPDTDTDTDTDQGDSFQEPELEEFNEGEGHDEIKESIETLDTSTIMDLSEVVTSLEFALPGSDDLVPRGRFEVRILREEPDLVGALVATPTPAAIDFISYLVLHGHRSTTSRLRDSIGTLKMQSARAEKTVWSAASAARKALGPDTLPQASGTQLYTLSAKVTCDWLRFRALLEIAQQPGIGRERCHAALIQALDLVAGVPASCSRRFLWLDHDGLLGEITRSITSAAAMLAALELEDGSPETARWALDKGLMLSPGDSQLHRLGGLLDEQLSPVGI